MLHSVNHDLDTEPGIEDVGQSQSQHMACSPAHDGHQVQETALGGGDIRNVHSPDLIEPLDTESL